MLSNLTVQIDVKTNIVFANSAPLLTAVDTFITKDTGLRFEAFVSFPYIASCTVEYSNGRSIFYGDCC